ncbi:DUF3000 domain-containing protein [Actinomadura parmotrematis]|uniref:DUF3000 domain-containing protein n=1 Tax=Actinomadura parmotrematis TaxID=2864039 RepID=A0ABS7FQ59_9ACTN|nr:DUF3000 domain-containing protein [Actinomadura parmotrematis]MBW8482365.1 DUF3000 domain-containing protein [Actinomadura parmotrematis]
MTAPADPPEFRRAAAALRAVLDGPPLRPELDLEDMPAPQRLAPYAAALSGSVWRDEDTEAATGRLIVLYDPDGRAGWTGGFRVVAYIQADLEPEIAADDLIGSVAWSWLLEALEPAGYAGESGTVTVAVSESFGDKADEPAATELELRASWSPTGPDLAGHVAAWCEVMCVTAGLPPSGAVPLPGRRGGAGR